jgi:hypothetical protein
MVPCRSGLETLVGLAVIHQLSDAVHHVLEQGGCCKYEHPNRWIDEWNRSKGGNEPGDLPGEAEVFECFHGEPG